MKLVKYNFKVIYFYVLEVINGFKILFYNFIWYSIKGNTSFILITY